MVRKVLLVAVLSSSVFALGGCKVVGKVKGGGKLSLDDAKSVKDSPKEAVPDAPAVAAAADDPDEVKYAIQNLEEAEKYLAEGNIDQYASSSSRLNYDFYAKKSVDGTAKGAKLKARLAALDAKAVKLAGGLLAKHYGDGKRVTQAKSEDVKEAMDKAISECSRATETSGSYSAGENYKTRLADNLKKYDEALQRALKVDPNIIRYVGDWVGSGYVDVPMKLATCEVKIAAHKLNLDDSYEPEQIPEGADVKKGCGKITWLANGVQLGADKFAPYTRTAGGQTFAEEVDCKSVPKKDKIGKELKGAVKEFKEYNSESAKKWVFVAVGKPYIEESNSDYRLHRWQQIEAYGKDMPLPANPCGGEKIVCEAGGSRGGRMFNETEHFIARADVHAGVRPERCKDHLKAAFKKWEEFRDFRDGKKKDGSWIEGATYKTKKGEKLPEADFVAKFEKLGKMADDRALGDYCTKRPAKGGGAKKAP